MKLWKCFHVKRAKLDKWSFFFVCSASVRQVGLQAVSVMSKVFFSGDENVTCSILSESGLWNDVGWSAVMHEKHIQDDLFHSYVLINTICRENKYLTSVKEEICRKCSVWFALDVFMWLVFCQLILCFTQNVLRLLFLLSVKQQQLWGYTCNKYFFLK